MKADPRRGPEISDPVNIRGGGTHKESEISKVSDVSTAALEARRTQGNLSKRKNYFQPETLCAAKLSIMYGGKINTEDKATASDLPGPAPQEPGAEECHQDKVADQTTAAAAAGRQGGPESTAKLRAVPPGEKAQGKARDTQEPLSGHTFLGGPEAEQSQHSY